MVSIRLLVVIVLFSLFFQAFSVTVQAHEVDAEHAIIVQYHDGQTPEDISMRVVSDRVDYKSTTFGSIQDLWETVVYKLRGKELPRDQLARMETVKRSTGVVETHELFTEDPDITDSYLITLEETRSVEDAVNRYRSMPEVESVEPAENIIGFGL